MEPNNESIRDRLLSRLPQPENLAAYRKEVGSLLEKNEKGLRREKWGAGATWFFVVGLGTREISHYYRVRGEIASRGFPPGRNTRRYGRFLAGIAAVAPFRAGESAADA